MDRCRILRSRLHARGRKTKKNVGLSFHVLRSKHWDSHETEQVGRKVVQPWWIVDETPVTINKRLIGHSYRSVGSNWLCNRGKEQGFHPLSTRAVGRALDHARPDLGLCNRLFRYSTTTNLEADWAKLTLLLRSTEEKRGPVEVPYPRRARESCDNG